MFRETGFKMFFPCSLLQFLFVHGIAYAPQNDSTNQNRNGLETQGRINEGIVEFAYVFCFYKGF